MKYYVYQWKFETGRIGRNALKEINDAVKEFELLKGVKLEINIDLTKDENGQITIKIPEAVFIEEVIERLCDTLENAIDDNAGCWGFTQLDDEINEVAK